MDEDIKKIIGFISLATKNIGDAVSDMRDQGSKSDQEGEKVMEDFKEATQNTKEEVESEFKGLIETILQKMDVARRSDLEELANRVKKLEEHEELKSRLEKLERKMNNPFSESSE